MSNSRPVDDAETERIRQRTAHEKNLKLGRALSKIEPEPSLSSHAPKPELDFPNIPPLPATKPKASHRKVKRPPATAQELRDLM